MIKYKQNLTILLFLLFILFSNNRAFCSDRLDNNSKKLLFWTVFRSRYEYQHNFNTKSYGDDPLIGDKDYLIKTAFRINI